LFDDILIGCENWSNLVEGLTKIFKKLRVLGLTARPSKMYQGFTELGFLGHTLTKGFLKPEEGKIKKILSVQVPKTKKSIRSLLGLLGYYRRYVPDLQP
jgi:hypothetical protein